MMHLPIAEQGKRLWQVLSGGLAYHAAPANFRALQTFRDQVIANSDASRTGIPI